MDWQHRNGSQDRLFLLGRTQPQYGGYNSITARGARIRMQGGGIADRPYLLPKYKRKMSSRGHLTLLTQPPTLSRHLSEDRATRRHPFLASSEEAGPWDSPLQDVPALSPWSAAPELMCWNKYLGAGRLPSSQKAL